MLEEMEFTRLAKLALNVEEPETLYVLQPSSPLSPLSASRR